MSGRPWWKGWESSPSAGLAPPFGADLLSGDNFRGFAWCGRPELQAVNREDAPNGFGPGMDCEIEESPVNGHEQTVATESAKRIDCAVRAHVNAGP